MRHPFLLPLITSCFFLLPACHNDPKQHSFDEGKLFGRWEIVTGYRNGKKTETLTGTFFEFSQDGNMKTNLTPTASEEVYPFTFDGTTISQSGDPAIAYNVDTLTDSMLALSMTINNFPFRVNLKKAPATSAPEEGIMQ